MIVFPRSIQATCLAVLLSFTAAATLRAQTADAPAELKALHERVAKLDAIVSVTDGRAALEKLKQWNINPETLKPEQRDMYWRTELFASAAAGDAARAMALAAQLRAIDPETRDPLIFEAVYVACAAGGKADTADQMLAKLNEIVPAGDKRVIANRRRWLKQVGETAPNVFIPTGNAEGAQVASRGGVPLIIDFWNVQQAPSEAQSKALRELYESLKDESKVEFVGVNTDSPARLEKAKQFVQKAGYAWKQHYEEQMTNAPITHQAFNAGGPPWDVLIDGEGRIRAVGTATEAAFVYAVRAAVAEAKGEFKPLVPRTVTGQEAIAKATSGGGSGGSGTGSGAAAGGGAGGKQLSSGELPSNEEAASMLRQARVYMKTGKRKDAKELLQKIIDQYPGTREANDAQSLITGL